MHTQRYNLIAGLLLAGLAAAMPGTCRAAVRSEQPAAGPHMRPTPHSVTREGALADAAQRRREVIERHTKAQAERIQAHARARHEGWKAQGKGYALQAIRDGRVIMYITENGNAAVSTAASELHPPSSYDLTGSGVTIGLWDEGEARATHVELTGRVTIKDAGSTSDHSTHVAGTLIATGVTASAKGMAPHGLVDSYNWDSDTSEMTATAMASPTATNRIQVSNHSYGTATGWMWTPDSIYQRWFGVWNPAATNKEPEGFGLYTGEARDWDALCYTAPYYLPFKSAGNDRDDSAPSAGTTFEYYGSGWEQKTYDPATDPLSDGAYGGYDTIPARGNAKNILTVGAVNDAISGGLRSVPNATMMGFSGWGPTDDGRIKPDIVANGASLYSCSSSGDAGYVAKAGTSMSAPNAAGSAALLVELYDRLYEGASAMRSSTLRGLIIHTADDIEDSGPDYKSGWGLMDTHAAADMISDQFDFANLLAVHEDLLETTNSTDTFDVPYRGSAPLCVTICWTDPPGTAKTALDDPTPLLMNDLDLRVVDPLGYTNYPFVLAPTNPAAPATSGDNILDNVEQVLINTPPTQGVYTITVSHKDTLVTGSQIYSLLVSGSTAPPLVTHTPLTYTSETSTPYTVEATITSYETLDTNSLNVCWSTNGPAGPFTTNLLTHATNNMYSGTIPSQPLGTLVSYYLSAATTNELQGASPLDAPATLHTFSVVPDVTLSIFGSPSDIGTAAPTYGNHVYASNSTVTAWAGPIAAETNGHRYLCNGWTGTMSVPANGDSNSVSFVIHTDSLLIWRWISQFSLVQTSSVPPLLDEASWWESGGTADTVTATESLDHSGTTYRFAGWTLDGLRQPDATNTAVNPVVGIAMTTSRTATALYLDEDTDGDGDALADWWEHFYFGSTNASPTVDSDGDGYLDLEEFQDGSDPRDPGSVPMAPVILHAPLADPQTSPAPWQVSAVVTDNFSVASVTLRWRRNGLTWRQAAMTPGGSPDLYTADIPAPGILGDTFEYRVQATDETGYFDEAGPYTFFVAYPISTATPDTIAHVVYAGTATNDTITVTNTGNTNLIWHIDINEPGMTDDIESGTNGWTHGGNNDMWHISTNRWASGSQSWYCGNPDGLYRNSMLAWLDTPTVRLASDAQLRFRHWITTELQTGNYAWDGAIVEISTDNRESFAQITPAGGYPYLIYGHADSPWPMDTPCFAGTGTGVWQDVVFDLSSYAGEDAVIRFHFGSDGAVYERGWYIDDLEITPQGTDTGWLTLAPSNGVLGINQTNIALTLDSAGLVSGTDNTLFVDLLSNDPLTPLHVIGVTLSPRTEPTVTILSAAQTSTNGEGLVSISCEIADIDGEPSTLSLESATNTAGPWLPLYVYDVAASQGTPGVTNGGLPQVEDILTASGSGLETNALTLRWATTNGTPIVFTTSALVRATCADAYFSGSAVTSAFFMVDNEPPGAPGIPAAASLPPASWSPTNELDISWSSASDGLGIGVRDYRLIETNAIPGTLPPGRVVSGTNTFATCTPDGSNWWLYVSAVDQYGNVGPAATNGPFWIDTTPPAHGAASLLLQTGEAGNYVIGSSAVVSWVGFSDTHAGIEGYYFATSDGSGTTNGTWTTNTIGLFTQLTTDWTNSLFVWGRDGVGHIGAAATHGALALSATGDYDQDGFSTSDEAIAGTDATDANSVFAFSSVETTSSGGRRFVVRWAGISNRIYHVDVAGAATNMWTAHPTLTNITGYSGWMAVTDQVDAVEQRLYRVRVHE